MRKWTGPFLLLLLIVFSTPSDARTIRNFKVGGWFAGAYSNSSSNEFSHCAASAHYRSGILVLFSIDRQFHWSMGFHHPDWRLQPGNVYEVAFTVDDLTPVAAKAVAVTTSQIRVPLADSVELFSRFKQGRVLKVATARRVFEFNLTSTSKLLPALLECSRDRGAPPQVASNPFEEKKKPPQPSVVDDASAKAEATVFAANLLSSAGITNFKLLGPNEEPEIKGHARWFQGSTFGTVEVLPKLSDADLRDLSGYLIGADAKACKGTFFSGAIPDDMKSTVARIFTTCQKDDKPITVYYLAIPRKSGGAYVISTVSLGSEKPAKEQDTLLRSAVFKLDQNKNSLQN